MSFRDFSFPEVLPTLGLTLAEADLHAGVAALDVSPEFAQRLRDDADLALEVSTEKARSEFLIAPVLAELRRMLGGRFGLISGSQFDVDASRGLNGDCIFLFTRSPLLSVISAPVVAIAEAKNDNIRTGLGQCIATMVAAWEFNAHAGAPVAAVHGVTTTGSTWKFLRLVGTAVTLDRREYYIAEPGRIMGIFAHVLTT